MFSKTAAILLGSLVATSGFSYFVSHLCNTSVTESATELVQQASLLSTPTVAPTALGKPILNSTAAPSIATPDAHPGLTFEAPVEYTYANDGTSRMFVVEQAGKIKVIDKATGATSADTYLDIKKRVAYGGEMGLLGLAFHPKFKENGYFYVNYTKNNPRETVISRFKASSANARQVDPASEQILFKFAQPYSNHNGGKVAFGPDGFLYIATGDGGSGGDPQNNAQNRASWLGKILRINVNGTEKGEYGIPADNPFKGNKDGYLEEIYAFGLRNPWRFSFDKQGKLWTGDVGQNEYEEIDVITKGGNYGWRIREGFEGYKASEKAATPLVEPIHQYSHSNGDLSVTGGYVYEGKAIPALANKYLFADYVSGRIWALTPTGPNKATSQLLAERTGTISAFGEDQSGELYICDHAGGKILKLTK